MQSIDDFLKASDELLNHLKSLVFLKDSERMTLPVECPFTGQKFADLPRAMPEDVDHAVSRARASQDSWYLLGVTRREKIIRKFHDLILKHQDRILDFCQLETGKARRHALEELLDTANVARYYAYRAHRFLKPIRRKGALPILTKTQEQFLPLGVVGFVIPWNYPINLFITDAIPALLAGNTVVLKPDHQVSYTALAIADLLYQAGVPRDVAPVVTGIGAELGPRLVEQVDFVMFTGSTQTGKLIASQASQRLIGYSLELGGKNPMIVLPDAAVDAAIDGLIRGAFVGSGQVCVSIERVYVHSSIYESFIKRLEAQVRRLNLGSGFDYKIEMGSLGSKKQLETIMAHINDAESKGAQVLVGGNRRPDLGPYFFEPTILLNVKPGMLPYGHETFGPVVSVYRYDNVDEAVAQANNTSYGLNASVWSRDAKRAMGVAKRIRSGSVNINECYNSTWASVDAAVGGMKESGFGRRHGREGILKYTAKQTVSVQRVLPISGPKWLSRSTYAKVMTYALKLMKALPGMR